MEGREEDDILEVCRLCLEKGDLISVFDERFNPTNTIRDAIEFVTKLEVSETDNISTKICPKCLQFLTTMTVKIAAISENSDKLKKRRSMLGASRSVKEILLKYPEIILPPSILKTAVLPTIRLDNSIVADWLKRRETEPTNPRKRTSELKKSAKRIKLTTTAHDVPEKASPQIMIRVDYSRNSENISAESSPVGEKLSNSEENASDNTQHSSPSVKKSSRSKNDSNDMPPDLSPPIENSNDDCSDLYTLNQTKSMYVCSICNAVYSTDRHLNRHKKKHMRCNLCKLTFRSMQDTEDHMNNHCLSRLKSNMKKKVIKREDEEESTTSLVNEPGPPAAAVNEAPTEIKTVSIDDIIIRCLDKCQAEADIGNVIPLAVLQNKSATQDKTVEVISLLSDDESEENTEPSRKVENVQKPEYEKFPNATNVNPLESAHDQPLVENSTMTESQQIPPLRLYKSSKIQGKPMAHRGIHEENSAADAVPTTHSSQNTMIRINSVPSNTSSSDVKSNATHVVGGNPFVNDVVLIEPIVQKSTNNTKKSVEKSQNVSPTKASSLKEKLPPAGKSQNSIPAHAAPETGKSGSLEKFKPPMPVLRVIKNHKKPNNPITHGKQPLREDSRQLKTQYNSSTRVPVMNNEVTLGAPVQEKPKKVPPKSILRSHTVDPGKNISNAQPKQPTVYKNLNSNSLNINSSNTVADSQHYLLLSHANLVNASSIKYVPSPIPGVPVRSNGTVTLPHTMSNTRPNHAMNSAQCMSQLTVANANVANVVPSLHYQPRSINRANLKQLFAVKLVPTTKENCVSSNAVVSQSQKVLSYSIQKPNPGVQTANMNSGNNSNKSSQSVRVKSFKELC